MRRDSATTARAARSSVPLGDFVTAPELGDLLGRALARTLQRELAALRTRP